MRLRAASLVLLLLVTGCGFFSRSRSRFYSLDRIAPATAPATAAGVPVAIEAIELPPGFDRREIIVRKNDRELDVRGTEQWSAALEPLVLHTLAFDLADRMPAGMVILPGQVEPAGARRAIDVVFDEIVAGPENRFTIDARWTLRDGSSMVSHREEIAIDLASLESAEVAAGLSRALAELADRIVARLR